MKKDEIIFKELAVDNYNVIIKVKGEQTIYTEKFYETLYILDMKIDDCFYENYYFKIANIDMLFDIDILQNIINNLYSITFKHNKYIGEIINNELVYDKYIEEQLKKKEPIVKVYKEYIKSDNKLKYEAFFEVYFSTHSVPLEIMKDYVSCNVFDILQVEQKIKNMFKGKIHKFQLEIDKLERKINNVSIEIDISKLENRIKICKYFLDEIEKVNKKNRAYNELKKELKKIKKTKDNIFQKVKNINKLNKKIKYVESKFNYEREIEKIKLKIKQKTKKDIIKDYDVNTNVIKEKIEEYIDLLKKEISKNKAKIRNIEKAKKELNNMSFDDIYSKIEQEVD